MDFLRESFHREIVFALDKDGNVVLDADGNVSIGETPFSPVEILRSDPDAYDQEFNAWMSKQWLPKQEAALKEILEVHANRKRFTDLCAVLKNEQLVPLVGSGIGLLPET